MVGIIYCAENNINGKCYIGQTILPLNKRRSNHINEKTDTHFHRALKKYDDWNWYIVQEYEADDVKTVLNKAETYYIEVYDTFRFGYNSTSGGDASYSYTKEVREKISKANSGRKHNQEYKDNCRNRMLGKKSPMKGRLHTKEAKDNNRKKHSIPVICLETGIVYPSAKNAYKETGAYHVNRCCRGERKTSGGFHWKYARGYDLSL